MKWKGLKSKGPLYIPVTYYARLLYIYITYQHIPHTQRPTCRLYVLFRGFSGGALPKGWTISVRMSRNAKSLHSAGTAVSIADWRNAFPWECREKVCIPQLNLYSLLWRTVQAYFVRCEGLLHSVSDVDILVWRNLYRTKLSFNECNKHYYYILHVASCTYISHWHNKEREIRFKVGCSNLARSYSWLQFGFGYVWCMQVYIMV